MIVHYTATQEQYKSVTQETCKPITSAQIGIDGLVHYTVEREVTQEDIINSLIDYLENHDMQVDYYTGCAEPGYEDQPVIATDWNDLPHDWQAPKHGRQNTRQMWRLEQLADKWNISLEWSDEWTRCEDCYKAIRHKPDSYYWLPSYLWASDHEIVCHKCYASNVDDIIDHYLVTYHHNLCHRAVTRDFIPHLEANGFTCWQTPNTYEDGDSCARYESGWYPGQTDTPEKVRDLIHSDSLAWEIIFVITDSRQFDCGWTAYVRKQQTNDNYDDDKE
jgi:hypothetical protein